jgi:hypothetical protein
MVELVHDRDLSRLLLDDIEGIRVGENAWKPDRDAEFAGCVDNGTDPYS